MTSRLLLVPVLLSVAGLVLGGEAPPPTPAPGAAAEPTPDGGYKNTLRWTTASEVDNFGFDVYRSTAEEGPFERITAEPIPGAGTVDEPQSYVFLDHAIDPEQGYYYYIESISVDGVREKFSPVTFVAAKKPAPGPPPATPEAEAAPGS